MASTPFWLVRLFSGIAIIVGQFIFACNIVMTAIHDLQPKYREVILLRDVQQLTYEEIEQVLNIPGGTVRSRINRARNALKEKLEPILGRR